MQIKMFFSVSLIFVILLFHGCGGGASSNDSSDSVLPVFTSVSSTSVNENQIGAISLSASYASPLTYSISGTDSTSFNINAATGVVTFINAPDFEAKTSYVFDANASDGEISSSQSVTISIINLNDNSPIFSSSTTASVTENQTSAITLVASDADNETLTYSISGTDATSFNIDAATGVVTFINAPDFETKTSYVFDANTSDGENSSTQNITISVIDVSELTIPTLVVVMNWNDYFETDPLVWSNKIFNSAENSVNRWYDETSASILKLAPAIESSGTINDGVIIVNMGKNHPGGANDTAFRDTEISSAISNSEVVDNMDFAALDINGDGALDRRELQIIFIVAGGEQSFGDPISHSVWAHAWSYDSTSTLKVDTVLVMRSTGNPETSGGYARFGANHGTHKATIGVIVHEIGHSLLGLQDYYDDGGGSGLGWFDVMSGGGWASQSTDIHAGETPTQLSAYNRIDANMGISSIDVNVTQDLTIKCSSNEVIKLVTSKTNEYFLLECRDSSKSNSDISFAVSDSTFTENRLFTTLYHVDDNKTDNTEDGMQTPTNHYHVALVEKDTLTRMTSTTNISAEYADVYTLGEVISTDKTNFYDGGLTNYGIEIIGEDYTSRTMTVRITK